MSIHPASTSCPITHPHVFSIRPPCFLHVPWCHTLNLRYTCAHHVYTIRNPCPLTSSPNPNSISRLFPILLDPKSFQTTLDYSTWLPGHVLFYLSVCCKLYTTVLFLSTNPNPKVCPHPCAITASLSSKIFCLYISGSFCKPFLFFWFHLYSLYPDSLSSSTFLYTAIWTKDYTWGLIRHYQQIDMVFQKFCLYSYDKYIS